MWLAYAVGKLVRTALVSASVLWLFFAVNVFLAMERSSSSSPFAIVCILPAVVAWNLATMAFKRAPMSAWDAVTALCVGASPLIVVRESFVFFVYWVSLASWHILASYGLYFGELRVFMRS